MEVEKVLLIKILLTLMIFFWKKNSFFTFDKN